MIISNQSSVSRISVLRSTLFSKHRPGIMNMNKEAIPLIRLMETDIFGTLRASNSTKENQISEILTLRTLPILSESGFSCKQLALI